MKKDNQTILVTGGAGFIGSHLCERLINEGYKVLCLDNFNNFYDPRLKEDNIRELRENSNFRLIYGDILDNNLLERIFRENKILKIIHLAALAGVRVSFHAPTEYVDVDVKGTVNLLEMAKKYQIPQFIFGSSSSVYGFQAKTPFKESERNVVPFSPYSVSKLAGEIFCRHYSKAYNIPITVLRIFSVYGPRQRPELVLHQFARKMKKGKVIETYGHWGSARDYTYVDDIIEGIVLAMKKIFPFEIFNLGNSKPVKLKTLLQILSQKLKMKPKIKKLKNQLGDLEITYADIKKAKKLLSWAPKISFTQGVERFLEWHKEKEKFLNSLNYGEI